MAITLTITQEDLLGLSPQFSQSIAKIKDWAAEVNDTVGSVSKELRVVASTAALKAVAAADRAEGDVAVLADSGQIMRFSAASSAPEALGPPITVIAPTAGSGRWLAVALPPQSSVDATALASNAVTTAKINAAAVTQAKLQSVVAVQTGEQLLIAPASCAIAVLANTAGNTDLSASGFAFRVLGARYIPDGTVGALSTVQVQTAGGAANLTEALDISAAAANEVKEFASVAASTEVLANQGLRIVTTGSDVAGLVVLFVAKTA